MRVTLLDKYVRSCIDNAEKLPVCESMSQVITQTAPRCHQWDEPHPLQVSLPNVPITWPDGAMCLAPVNGVTPGVHRCVMDVDYQGVEFDMWFNRTLWSLTGMLVFQPDEMSFDVIPLIQERTKGQIVLNEVQLHFDKLDSGWAAYKARTGPVNALFHDVFYRLIEPEDREQVTDNLNYLINITDLCLGTYYQRLQQPGEWHEQAPKPPRVKMKNDKVVKVYNMGSLGYRQYNPKEHEENERTTD